MTDLLDDKKFAAKLKREKRGASELDVANQCDAMAVTMGWHVERYDQRRASGIHKGLPDRRYTKDTIRCRVWIDHKAPAEKMSREQARWMEVELQSGGHAAPIDSVESLVALLRIFNGSSTGDSWARTRCTELYKLCVARGFRAEKKPR